VRLFISALLSVGVQSVDAAFESVAADTRSLAMGVAGVSCSGFTSGLFSNPSRAASMQTFSISAGFTPAPFDIPELRTASVSITVPLFPGSLFAGFSSSGFDLYREHTFRVGFGASLSGSLDAGMNLTFYSLGIARYGHRLSTGIDLGLRVRIGGRLILGFTACNVTGASARDGGSDIPQVFAAGLSFRASDDIAVVADVSKDLHFPADAGLGIEYAILGSFQLRAGISTSPSTMNGGAGIVTEILRIDYAVQIHPVLGPTHQIGVVLLPGAW
jgi:hypothetical protein